MHYYTYISFKNRIYIKIYMYMFVCVCVFEKNKTRLCVESLDS